MHLAIVLVSIPLPAVSIWLVWKLGSHIEPRRLTHAGLLLSWAFLLIPPLSFMLWFGHRWTHPLGPFLLAMVLFAISLCLGIYVIYLMDRDRRATTWSVGQALRTLAGPALVDFIPFITLIIAIVLLAPLLGDYHVVFQTSAALGLLMVTCSLFFTTYPFIMKWVWRTHPLPDGPERTLVNACLHASGIQIGDVAVIPTRGGKVVNAMVSGILPRTRTIFVTDTLLQRLTPAEVRCIVAHELGHLHHRHLVKYFFFSIASALFFSLAMYGLSLLIPQSVSAVTLQGIVLGTIVAGVFGRISKRFEREADLFALRITHDPEALISALGKLEVVLRKATDQDSSVSRWFGTHPNLAERVSYVTESSGETS